MHSRALVVNLRLGHSRAQFDCERKATLIIPSRRLGLFQVDCSAIVAVVLRTIVPDVLVR